MFFISDYFTEKLTDFFNNLIPQTPAIVNPPSSIPVAKKDRTVIVAFTYKKYSSNLSALTNMLASLKKNKFVSNDTDIKEFRKIFDNKNPNHPIQWIGNISELRYFVKLLNSDLKLITDLKKDIWRVTGALFVDENNIPFDWKKFRRQKNPARAELIKSCVSHLK